MSIMFIWIIGFLFCLGITDYEKERHKQKASFWVELGMIFLLLGLWPHFLGYTVAGIKKTNKKKGKK